MLTSCSSTVVVTVTSAPRVTAVAAVRSIVLSDSISPCSVTVSAPVWSVSVSTST